MNKRAVYKDESITLHGRTFHGPCVVLEDGNDWARVRLSPGSPEHDEGMRLAVWDHHVSADPSTWHIEWATKDGRGLWVEPTNEV